MSYSAEISRSNPTAFLILIDQSFSMSDQFGGGNDSKSAEAAKIVNRILTELTIKCAKDDEGLRHYFDVGVLGYGANVRSALSGGADSSLMQPITSIGENPLRLDRVAKKVPDGAGGLVDEEVDFPVWVDPVANGSTPMREALGMARDVVRDWVSEHPNAYPPTVINITDGESTDGNPMPIMKDELSAITTSDGTVLVFNCHITGGADEAVLFPFDIDRVPQVPFARELFEASSEFPTKYLELAQSYGLDVQRGSRGFAYNADLGDLTMFLQIGTMGAMADQEFRE